MVQKVRPAARPSAAFQASIATGATGHSAVRVRETNAGSVGREDTFAQDGRGLIRAALALPRAPWAESLLSKLHERAGRLEPDRLPIALRDPDWCHALEEFHQASARFDGPPGTRRRHALEQAFQSAVRRATHAARLDPHPVVLRVARGGEVTRSESLVREALDWLAGHRPDAYARMLLWTSTIEVRPGHKAGWTTTGAPGLTSLGHPFFGEAHGRAGCVFLIAATLIHEAGHHALNATPGVLARPNEPVLRNAPSFVYGRKTAASVLGEAFALTQGAALVPGALRRRAAPTETVLNHYEDLVRRLRQTLQCLTPAVAEAGLSPTGQMLLSQVKVERARISREVTRARRA